MTDTDKTTNLTTDDASPGWDMMLEDMFGLNFRGARTMWDLIVRPADVFQAARRSDWLLKYTPSVRLTLSILALLMLLRFIWGSEDSLMQRNMMDLAQADPEIADDPVFYLILDLMFSYWYAVLPFVYAVLHIIGALAFRIWPPGTTATEHVRLYFAALAPATLVGVAIMVATANMPKDIGMFILYASYGAYIIIYFLTMFRGLKSIRAKGRAWRAGLFAFVALMIDQIASLVAIGIAILVVLGSIALGFHHDEMGAAISEKEPGISKEMPADTSAPDIAPQER